MIEADRHYTISEVSEITGYENHVLRYYEKEFELEIPRNEANHRYYTYKEIESFKNIRALQEKGFTNKQIKLILNSPEVLINEQQDETAATVVRQNPPTQILDIEQISYQLKEIIENEIKPAIAERDERKFEVIEELKNEVIQLKNEIQSKERDVLICENAKLKMKLKEKSYEVVEYKDKLKREQQSNTSFFSKIFNNMKKR